MEKGFKKLLGNRIYLLVPEQKEAKVILAPMEQAEVEKEFVTKFDKLEVYAVGEGVVGISVGDKVLVDPNDLQKAPILTIGKNKVILISYFNIIHIW